MHFGDFICKSSLNSFDIAHGIFLYPGGCIGKVVALHTAVAR